MNKTLIPRAVLLTVASLIAYGAFAEPSIPDALSEHCAQIAQQLNELAVTHPTTPCADDMTVASAYLTAAAVNIQQGNMKLAQTALHHSEHELKAISEYRPYCHPWGLSVKPFLAQAILIGRELNRVMPQLIAPNSQAALTSNMVVEKQHAAH